VNDGEDANAVEYSSTRSEPSIHSTKSGSLENPKDTDCLSNVAGHAGNVVEANSSQDENVNPILVTNCQPSVSQAAALNLPDQHSAAEELSLTASVQPNPTEVSQRKKKQTFCSKKRAQKQKADDVSSEAKEVTWKVSSHDDSATKNVLLIRREHPAEIPDTCQELASCPVQETTESAPFQSTASYKINCDVEDRNLCGKTGEGGMIQEYIASVTQETSENAPNTATVDKAGTQAEMRGVDSTVSADGRDIIGNQSTKRRRKMATKAEACRKSQRCSSRRQSAEEFVPKTSTTASSSEVKTAGLHEGAQETGNVTVPCSVLVSREAVQEQIALAQNSASMINKAEPAVTVSSFSTSQTKANTRLSEGDHQTYSSTASTCTSTDNIVKHTELVTLTVNTNLVSQSTLKSLSTGFTDRPNVTHSSEDKAALISATHISSSSCSSNVQSSSATALEMEPPINSTENDIDSSVTIKLDSDAVKHESHAMCCSYSAADTSAFNQSSSNTSLLDTCLSGTILETLVSPKEQLSHSSASHLHAADDFGQQQQNTGVTEAPSCRGATSADESETEEVCKTILEEVVANVVKETCLMSTAKESAEDVDSLTEPAGSGVKCGMTQMESDSTSGEIPLKKRRGRRVFADCQPGSASITSRRTDDVRHASSSSHRRKVSNSNPHRRAPRGNKYVGAHTSIIGKLLTNIVHTQV